MNESADALEVEAEPKMEMQTQEPVREAELIEATNLLPANIDNLTDEQKAEVGHSIQGQIVVDTQNVMARYLRIGKNLYAVAKYELFKQLGYTTFDEWRAQPEMQIARTTSYALMRVYEVFVERLKVEHAKLTGLDWTKLYAISKFVTDENVDDMLSKVETLSRGDLQREISTLRQRLTGKSQSQAEAHVEDLDFVRECCPIGCGSTCPLIAADEDAAVMAFKKWLAKWRSINARIKGLFGKSIGKSQKHERRETVSDAPAPQEVPPVSGNSPTPERCESHLQEPKDVHQNGQVVHGQDVVAGGKTVEAGSVAHGEGGKESVWPT